MKVLNLPETKYLVKDPSSYINLFLKKLIKKGLAFLSYKILYNFLLLVHTKGKTTLNSFFENAIEKGKTPVGIINYSMRGKKYVVPGLISNNEARINFIKNLIAIVKKDSNSKTLPQALLSEIENLNNTKGQLYKDTQANYEGIRSTVNLGKKIYNKQFQKNNKNKNAIASKKKFFVYI